MPVTTTKRYPGKFEGNYSEWVAEHLYNVSLDGCDDDVGDVEGFGWYGLIRGRRYGFIVSEDGQGFFDYIKYATPALAQTAFEKIAYEREE